MAFLPPIFDRTQEDVEYQKLLQNLGYENLNFTQKQDWDAGLKASLNFADVNRIENNTEVLASVLKITGLNFKTDWAKTDILDIENAGRIRDNVDVIRNTSTTVLTLPQTPDLPLNTYQKINDLEQILYLIYNFYFSQT